MQVRVTPSGFIDKDTDPQYVGQGNYLHGQNIRHRQTDGSNYGGVMSVEGNSLATSIPAYTTNTPSYRVYIDVEDIANGSVAAHEGELYLTTSTGSVFQNLTANISTTSLSSYRSALVAYLDALSNSAYGGLLTHSALVTTGTYTGYWDVSTGLDTFIKLTEVGIVSNLCVFKLSSEYISSNGVFSPVGSIQLNDDLFVLSAGSVTNPDGTSEISEIGVIYPSGVGYAYTRLMRSKQLTFHAERNADMQIEQVGSQINIYWTDDLNEPRVVYLKESLKHTTDGLLFINGGRYEFDSINQETKFFQENSTAYIDNLEVVEGAGNVTSGNKRYTGRFLSEDFVSAGFMYPTNPINIYNAEFNNPDYIQGDEFGTITNKGVRMTLKDIEPGIYKYFELVVLEYSGIAMFPKTVQRFELTNEQTELELIHSEIGQDLIPLSQAELISLTKQYNKAKSIRLFDNRMVMSNMSEELDLNLSDWAEQIEHSIAEDYIDGIGIAKPAYASDPGYSFGEYMDPNNVLNKVGYMYNDTYRFGIQVQWKSSKRWSAPYWVDDIRIDNGASNVVGTRRKTFGGSVTAVDTGTEIITVPNHGFYNGQAIVFTATTIGGLFINTIYYVLNATQNTFQVTPIYGGTTAENLTSGGTGTVVDKKVDTNLTDANAELVKVYYPRFHNIDLDYTEPATGEKIRDLIVGYRFVRAERIPEVLSTGYFFIGVNNVAIENPENCTFSSYTLSGDWIPWGMSNNNFFAGANPYTQHLFFFSPDEYYGKNSGITGNEEIKILGFPYRTTMQEVRGVAEGNILNYLNLIANTPPFPIPDLTLAVGHFTDFSGFFVDPQVLQLDYQTFQVDAYTYLPQGSSRTTRTGNTYSSGYSYAIFSDATPPTPNITDPLPCKRVNHRNCHVFELTTQIPNLSAPVYSNGYGFYYGQVFADKGGNKKYPINKEQTQYQSIGPNINLTDGSNGTQNNIPVYGGDVFTQKSFGLYRMGDFHEVIDNTRNTATVGCSYGFYSQNTQNLQMLVLEPHNNEFEGPGNQYPQLLDKSLGGTYPVGSWGSGVCYWNEQWPEVSNQQGYSKSYDIKDLSLLENGYDKNSTYDGNLPTRLVWSAKKILGSLKDSYRQFSPLDFADLDLTYGEISHHEVLNNSFYTWQDRSFQRQYFRDASLVNSQSGSDIVVGSGSILGAPGQEYSSIGCSKKWSIVKGINNNGKDTVYWFNDDKLKMMRFAQDGVNVISDRGMATWFLNNANGYQNKQYPLSGQGIHGVWNSKYNEAIFTFLPGEGSSYTVIYDELKNGFISFNTHYPRLYMGYKTGLFSPNPGNQAQIYIHDSGSEGSFYGITNPGTIEAIMNYDGNMSKNFEAIQVDCELVPNSILFETRQHESDLSSGEFEYREDYYYSPIKNDSTTSGTNDADTSRLWGRWIKMNMSLSSIAGGQKLINFIVKFRPMSRLYNQ